ncbi:acetylglutamate kinase [Glaciecola petra]|uniref:Acetylglutamate kinase n=1 Tax=Glaciecola petra TaxID=3075602 RepID=A0ABU2ZVA2_9ALTE|nr:acetylglutamate kinase [Aestuariibacter sp. P117]MDT0595519.1 acetylglutamate kinase [Aestuariibacter sp. P117]
MKQISHDRPLVIKVGGRFFEELQESESGANVLLNTLAILHKKGRPIVIVHGGGVQVLDRLTKLGFTSERKNGLRVTPDEHMPIVTSVLAGELNKGLVAQFAIVGVNAVGISLADGDIAKCTEHPDNIGAVGEVHAKSSVLIDTLLSNNMLTVVASIGKDDNGRLYNVNADHAAICIASLLQTGLYFFADVEGVLDANKNNIAELNASNAQQLIADGVITDGMIVKVQAALFAANKIKQAVTIAACKHASNILLEDKLIGTKILSHQ